MPIVIIALITLLAGGGEVIVASQNSLPGERLFPVKLVTENIRLMAAMGDDSKQELLIGFAEKRVQEINDVLESLEGQEVEDQHLRGLDRAAESLNRNLTRIEDRAKDLRSKGQNSRALEMNEDLKATAGVLNQALELRRSSSQEVELRNRLDNAITRNEDLRREAENEIRHINENESGDDSQVASQRIEAVRGRVGEVEVEIERAGDGIRQESRLEAQRGLDSARDLLEAAGVDISAGRNRDAFERANEALRAAAIANALISADSELRNIEDNPSRLIQSVRRENRQLETGISIEARILGNATDARVEARFPVNSADRDAIAQAIVDKLKLSRDGVASLIEIRQSEVDQLQTRSEARAEVEGSGADVRIRMRFPLNTIDADSIIQGIANRLAVLSINDVKNALDLRGNSQNSDDQELNGGSSSDDGAGSGRELELGDDRLFRSSPIPANGIDVRGQEAELRGRANEPGEDVRGQEAELRGRANEPGEDISGNADESEVRGGGVNGIEAPGDQPRQEDRSPSSIDDNPGVSSGGGASSAVETSSGGSSGGSGGGSSSGGGGGSSGGGGGGGGGSSDD